MTPAAAGFAPPGPGNGKALYHHLRGRVFSKGPGFAVLEAGGVGFLLHMTDSAALGLPAPGQETLVYVHHAVRENEVSLYGFASPEERSLFLQLLRVSGIGPATALQVLAQAELQKLVQAIVTGDTAFLVRLKGVGKKTAERIVVELRDRLRSEGAAEPAAKGGAPAAAGPYPDDAFRALLVLGLSAELARERLSRLAAASPPPRGTEEWIRLALRHG